MGFRDLLRQPQSGLVAAGFTVKRNVWSREVTPDIVWRFVVRQDPDQRPYIGVFSVGVHVPGVRDAIPDHVADSQSPGLIGRDISQQTPWRQGMRSFVDVRLAGRGWLRRPADPQQAALDLVAGMVADGLAWLAPFTAMDAVVAAAREECRPTKQYPRPWQPYLVLAGLLWKQGDPQAAKETIAAGLSTWPDDYQKSLRREASKFTRVMTERYGPSS